MIKLRSLREFLLVLQLVYPDLGNCYMSREAFEEASLTLPPDRRRIFLRQLSKDG